MDKVEDMKVLDVGAGSGYFIKALLNNGFNSVKGYEVSNQQTTFANEMLNSNIVDEIEMDNLLNLIKNTNLEIISMIGVLEHLTNPREILKAISGNRNIKYYYLSLPLFSFSVLFELLNEDYFNRQLSGGHTHLYTNESIDYFCEEFKLEIISKWFFCADAMDLFRFSLLKMNSVQDNKLISDFFEKNSYR